MIQKAVSILICLLLVNAPAYAGSAMFDYCFADADQAAELLRSNRDYFDRLNQNDLDYRMQRTGATLEEMIAFAAAQTLDFTVGEKDAIDATMDAIELVCREQRYVLPSTEGIVFAKTTMREECGANAYTHGTQIYLGQNLLKRAVSGNPEDAQYFREVVAHEVFHCMTRMNPDFRAAMYAILGFTVVDEDFDFSPELRDEIISNPDVEHHNAFATFTIDGVKRDCAVVITAEKSFAEPGDNFMDHKVIGLVPVDDLGTMYSSDDASDFWDVFGRNTSYVIDPEETMADNFRFTIMRGLDDAMYESPGIIRAIDAYLKGGAEKIIGRYLGGWLNDEYRMYIRLEDDEVLCRLTQSEGDDVWELSGCYYDTKEDCVYSMNCIHYREYIDWDTYELVQDDWSLTGLVFASLVLSDNGNTLIASDIPYIDGSLTLTSVDDEAYFKS